MSFVDDFPRYHEYPRPWATASNTTTTAPTAEPTSAFQKWFDSQPYIDALCASLWMFVLCSIVCAAGLLWFGVMDWKGNLYLDPVERRRRLAGWRHVEPEGIDDQRSDGELFIGRPWRPGGITIEERQEMDERMRVYEAAGREERRRMEYDIIHDRLRLAGYF